jgi:transcriptional regulator with XRE-family HTH domain
MNATQCRMARTGLKWTAAELAKAAGVGYATVARFEAGGSIQSGSLEKMRAALAAAGAEFINGGKSVGVRVPRDE